MQEGSQDKQNYAQNIGIPQNNSAIHLILKNADDGEIEEE